MKKIHQRIALHSIQFAIVLGLGVVIASLPVVIWLYNAQAVKIVQQKSPNGSSLAQAVDGKNLIGDWGITDATIASENVLIVTVSTSKKLGVTTSMHGDLAIFLRGQKVLDFAVENEIVEADIGSKSLVLRSTVSSALEDAELQDLRIEWTPSGI